MKKRWTLAFMLIALLIWAVATYGQPADPDTIIAQLRAADQPERERILRSYLRSTADSIPSVNFQFQVVGRTTVKMEGSATAAVSGSYCAEGRFLVRMGDADPSMVNFLAYRLQDRRGFWRENAVAEEEFRPSDAADKGLAARLRSLRVPNPILFAYGDGEFTIDGLLERYRDFPRTIDIEEEGTAVRIIIELFHQRHREEIYPFLRVELAPEVGCSVDRIEERWPDGRLSQVLRVKKRIEVQNAESIVWLPAEYEIRNGDDSTVIERIIITGAILRYQQLEDEVGDLATLCGTLPAGTHLLRRFDNGSSTTYVVRDGALVPQRIEPPALEGSDEFAFDPGGSRSWRDAARAIALALGLVSLSFVCVRLYRSRVAGAHDSDVH